MIKAGQIGDKPERQVIIIPDEKPVRVPTPRPEKSRPKEPVPA